MPARTQLAQLCGTRGEIFLETVESPALHGNALGDPSQRSLAVYVPPGYDDEGSARYPAIYVLHGYTGSVAGSLATRPWERNVLQWADTLVWEGRMPPAIVAAVDGFTRLGGSQYVDSVHNGNYATYVTRDVVGHVDRRFRTIGREGGRAIVGKSSGGFGALHLCMEYPGVFAAAGSHSGDAYFRYAYPSAFVQAQRALEKFDFDLLSFVEDFERRPKRSQDAYVGMEMLGYASAYSPRAAEPFAFDLPFDLQSGDLRQDVFDRWLAFDPVERVPHRLKALARLRLRYLDCGRRDEYGLDIGARLVARAMREGGLTVRHEEFDDDHRNVGYRYEISLPALAGVLDTE